MHPAVAGGGEPTVNHQHQYTLTNFLVLMSTAPRVSPQPLGELLSASGKSDIIFMLNISMKMMFICTTVTLRYYLCLPGVVVKRMMLQGDKPAVRHWLQNKEQKRRRSQESSV